MKLTGNPDRACRIVKPIWPPVKPQQTQEEWLQEVHLRAQRKARRLARRQEQKGGRS